MTCQVRVTSPALGLYVRTGLPRLLGWSGSDGAVELRTHRPNADQVDGQPVTNDRGSFPASKSKVRYSAPHADLRRYRPGSPWATMACPHGRTESASGRVG